VARHTKAERDEIMAETRQALLRSAAQEFARHGYAGAKIDRISTAAGFAKGTVYNYFEGKQALMLALFDEIAATHVDFVARQVGGEEDPARQLERFFASGFEFVEHHPAQARVMLNTIYGHDAAFKAHIFAAYQPMFQLVSRIIRAGTREGVFRLVDPDATAMLLMTIYLGAASQVEGAGMHWLKHAQVAEFALYALGSRQ
jgi:AcrR family transcriptional regulator